MSGLIMSKAVDDRTLFLPLYGKTGSIVIIHLNALAGNSCLAKRRFFTHQGAHGVR